MLFPRIKKYDFEAGFQLKDVSVLVNVRVREHFLIPRLDEQRMLKFILSNARKGSRRKILKSC